MKNLSILQLLYHRCINAQDQLYDHRLVDETLRALMVLMVESDGEGFPMKVKINKLGVKGIFRFTCGGTSVTFLPLLLLVLMCGISIDNIFFLVN